ncbi:MAG TPA: carboxypeptidase regulatory-like domain-containing protein [Gemmatimonadales bacterium]|nr:carboxypeptidase regulatory-like domain-containing protein [Gemmatimonadales bacterium]
MRWKSLVVLAVFLVGMAADLSARQSPPLPPPGPASFSGRVVVDSISTPIEGAFVELVGTVLRGVTDSSGSFAIIEVPAGTYVVRVRGAGFLEELFEVEVVDGEDLEGIIALKRVLPGARSEKGDARSVWEAAWSTESSTTQAPRFSLLTSPSTYSPLSTSSAADTSVGAVPQ